MIDDIDDVQHIHTPVKVDISLSVTVQVVIFRYRLTEESHEVGQGVEAVGIGFQFLKAKGMDHRGHFQTEGCHLHDLIHVLIDIVEGHESIVVRILPDLESHFPAQGRLLLGGAFQDILLQLKRTGQRGHVGVMAHQIGQSHRRVLHLIPEPDQKVVGDIPADGGETHAEEAPGVFHPTDGA